MTVPTTFPADSNTTWPLNTTLCPGPSCPVTDDLYKVLRLALSTGLSVMLALVMFSMGCSVDPLKLWGHIRRPWGITLGVLCQFGIMPLTAFTLTKAFNVLPIQAMVILIMGCCPGGTGSNILTYWMDGDMDLSVSMTTCTTILAMGMMPLCLYIYSSHWASSSTIQIPYHNIGVSLVCLMIPVALGSCIKHRWPKAGKEIVKVGSVMGVFLIIVIAVVAAVLYKSSWSISPSLWIIGAIFPFLGFSLGFLFSWLVRQSRARCRTIALETAFQNAHLCSTIMQLSFSHEELELMFTFPLIYCVFQIVLGLVTVGGYQVYKWYMRLQKDEATRDHEREAQCQLMNERSSGGGRFIKL